MAIHTDDGRFSIKLTDDYRRDVVISGRGFKRQIIRSSEQRNNDLGDINVTRGGHIEGVVRDEKGAPVANAQVSFSPTRNLDARSAIDEEQDDLLRGRINVTTDSNGRYVIDGCAPQVPWSKHPDSQVGPMQLRAWADHRSSPPILLADVSGHVDITVVPAGSLEVSAAFAHGALVEWMYARPMNVDVGTVMYTASRDDNTPFRFDELPVGEYLVFGSAHYLSEEGAKKVVVTAGNVARVQLDP
jgi:hypothetical protein